MTVKHSILLVEDEPESLATMTEVLTAEGFDVLPAESGETALASVARRRPDLILLEIRLPGIDGFEVCRRLKANAETSDIPVILLTVADELADRVEGLKLGAADTIVKPFRWVECLVRIRAQLELKRLDGLRERPAELGQHDPESRTEVDDRRQADEALRESEQRYRSLFENMLNGFAYCRMIFEQDQPTDFVYLAVNAAFESLTGLKSVTGRKVSEIIPGIREADPGLFEIYGRVARTGVPAKFETYVAALKMWFAISVYSPRQDHFVAVFDVITDRKLAEASLRESRELLRAVVEGTSDVVYVKDMEGRYRLFNGAASRTVGKHPDEVLGKDDTFLFPIDEARNLMQADRAVMTAREVVTCEESVTIASGDISTYLTTKGPVFDDHGNVSGVFGISRDITDRKRAQEEREKLREQLLHAQKMESVGRLAGGVVHDFNNMLGVILGHVELAMGKVDPAHPLRAHLVEIQVAARRSADLTRHLLAFARKQTIAPRVLDLNNAIAGTLTMLRRLIGEDIDLAWMPGPDLWPVRIDPSQIDQMLANLCVNARDAIDGVGKITIETENFAFDDAYCRVHADFAPGQYVMFAVSDDGRGMEKRVIDHLFEPFFTTKAAGRGTGLGLATVYGIVKQNDGFVHVYSEPGRGTTFKIYLRRFAGEVAESMIADAAETPRGHGETLLLVEDEVAIVEMATTMLDALGYTVLTAGTPGDAIRLSQTHKGQVHLLLTDVVMPEMNGHELAERIRAIRPGVTCLFMSGYTADVIAHRGVLEEGVEFLQKPFSIRELAVGVHRALERQRGGSDKLVEGGPC